MSSTNIDDIVEINFTEIITTSIDTYFKREVIVAEFENAALLNSHVFSTDGYEVYQSLSAVAQVFPTTHIVYKLAQDAFTQKTNTGMNKSSLERLIIAQVKSTDSSFEAALTRIGYADAHKWVCASRDAEDIESFVNYFADKTKMPHVQTSDADVLTDTAGNIAETLVDASKKAVLYYHAIDDEGLDAAMASMFCFTIPGRIAGVFDAPTGITIDTFTDNEKSKLDANFVNFYTHYMGQTGNIGARPRTAGGYMTNGELTQKQEILDRIKLNLQSAAMDAFDMKIPYSDNGGVILEGKLTAVLKQLQKEGIIDGNIVGSTVEVGDTSKGFELRVLTMQETQTDYISKYAVQKYVAIARFRVVVNAKSVEINITYSL